MKPLVGQGKPLHSSLDKAAGLLRRKVGTGSEFLKELMAIPGVKQTEVQERGLGEIMGMPRMTHDQFMANLAVKPPAAIHEKVLQEQEGLDDPSYLTREERNTPQDDEPHHEKYTLPGGENYREMLIKAPTKMEKGYKSPNGEFFTEEDLADPIVRKTAEKVGLSPATRNVSNHFEGVNAHFGGEKGILASMRVKDRLVPDLEGPHNVKVMEGSKFTNVKHKNREDAERFAEVKHQGGYKTEITPLNHKKYLHLEELQSDWHQQGREHGYKGEDANKNVIEAARIHEDLRDQLLAAKAAGDGDKIMDLMPKVMAADEAVRKATDIKQRGVPDAPFKKNWEEVALKRLIHHAAEKGYHGIVVTPGAEQADRYSLAKQVGTLSYNPETKHFQAFKPNRETLHTEKDASPERVAELVGKDVAQRLFKAPQTMGHHTIEGDDLKLGGEGMKGFYDKKVPNILNSIGKKYGAKVGKVGINSPKETPWNVGDAASFHGMTGAEYLDHPDRSQLEKQFLQERNKNETQLHHFPITEEMRKDVLTNGLPLYSEGGIIHKAQGGNVQPSMAQMRMALAQKGSNVDLQSIGVNEAPDMSPKHYFPPDQGSAAMPSPGGVATPSGMPIGGVDTNAQQTGQQFMPSPLAPQTPPPQEGQPPQGQPPSMAAPGMAPQGPTPPMGNLLQMTPQGQTMAALGGGAKPPGMAKGGSAKSTDDMKRELAAKQAEDGTSTRIKIDAEGSGGVKGIVVPRHMWEGKVYKGESGKKVEGMKDVNAARAKVYGSENREPLTIGQIGKIHRDTLAEHFQKPHEKQIADEDSALNRLREAKHIGRAANTLDESEKLDTVRHEHDEQGRTHIGFASKGVAGHSLYTSGHGDNLKHHVINTCPGQTTGCGGGTDKNGIVDSSKGTCFAPNAEAQYVNAAVRRASHEQAKHDPAMTKDWILAHTGSLRNAARLADRNNQRLLFRPNVVDETDVSSRHAIRHLNEQRKAEDKPAIIANSYGKTNELHDPENGYYVTHSNVGPKVKKGQEIEENIGRDKARVRNTIMAADNKGDFKNEQGNKTPPRGSYMVTDVKRGSSMAKNMEKAITHAKYWSTGRPESELTREEKEEGPEGHFGGTGRKTTEDKAHYGHRTHEGLRYDYQRQHILHPRLVNVPERKKNKVTGKMESVEHMIPTDSRFKDEEFLPKNRFKTKNGKDAGHILMTTPTESTSNIGHQTSFTHHVSDKHIEHAQKNNGEYEIDKPEDQAKAKGKEYAAPQSIKFYAEGGAVGGRHPGLSDDDFHAFPEQNIMAQRHLAKRGHDYEKNETKGLHYHSGHKKAVVVHKNLDTMKLEMNTKAK